MIPTIHIPTPARIGAKLVLAAALGLWAWQLPTEAPRAATAPAPPARARPAATPAPPAEPAFRIETALALGRPLKHGEYAWTADPVPAGPIWVHVDIARQTIRIIRGTSEIGRAIILYGADDKPTPLGQFAITEKDADHVSNLYHVPMPHMLRLTDDGIAIHGSSVEYGVATHGCIGVPEEFAAMLFAEAAVGDAVVITNGTV